MSEVHEAIERIVAQVTGDPPEPEDDPIVAGFKVLKAFRQLLAERDELRRLVAQDGQ